MRLRLSFIAVLLCLVAPVARGDEGNGLAVTDPGALRALETRGFGLAQLLDRARTTPIPNDANHLHFGAGQTEAKISLTPGPHTLQLLLADDKHLPHDPPVYSKPIKVIVTATGRRPVSHRHHRHSYSYR